MKQAGCALLLSLLSLPVAGVTASGDSLIAPAGGVATSWLQAITDDLRFRLSIFERVEVLIAEHNPLVMSVATSSGRSGPFVITADAAFIRTLTDEELRAAIAHELGHVWIYTHHPYVQSERLANDIALRVTSRAHLEPVYEKVWKRIGIRGRFEELLGQ
jgi:hypothetical protein